MPDDRSAWLVRLHQRGDLARLGDRANRWILSLGGMLAAAGAAGEVLSIVEQSKRSGICWRSCYRAVAELEAAGIIRRERERFGARKLYRYRLSPALLGAAAVTSGHID